MTVMQKLQGVLMQAKGTVLTPKCPFFFVQLIEKIKIIIIRFQDKFTQ